jgi:hypothetical protein
MRKLETPNGYDEMVKVFGNIRDYILEDGTLDLRWELNLDYCYLPFPMVLSWNKEYTVFKFRCHYLLKDIFADVFTKILVMNLEKECKYFGGCYSFRAKRNSKKLSVHSWGCAIDLNPETNQLGTKGDMHPDIVKIFEDHGFVWGGNFSVPDPMHFQFVKNY